MTKSAFHSFNGSFKNPSEMSCIPTHPRTQYFLHTHKQLTSQTDSTAHAQSHGKSHYSRFSSYYGSGEGCVRVAIGAFIVGISVRLPTLPIYMPMNM